MENAAHSSVNPNVRFLTEIIEEMGAGQLLVPNFQRPYVWKPNDVISLFDSIYKGYPIGSLLFWETPQKLITFTKIGPFSIDNLERPENNFILDGHQRLATLFGVLHSKTNVSNDDLKGWNLHFDLDKEEFLFPSGKDDIGALISMDKVINTFDFLEECTRIQKENTSRSSSLIPKAQKLAQSIITYKLSITQIKGGDLTSAVEIFSRLNTKGMDITADQMLSALTYREGSYYFNLAERIDEIQNKLIPYGFSDIERIFVFRAIIAAARRDIYKVKLETLALDKKLNFPSIVSQAEESIVRAAEFLYETLGVPGDKLLPYNLQFVYLSEFFYNQPAPTKAQLNDLSNWFWLTSYTGWFAGANNSKVSQGLEEMRRFARGEKLDMALSYDPKTITAFPDKFDFRYARIKSFVLFLLSLGPEPLEHDPHFNPKEALRDNGAKAIHSILNADSNNFANRILLGPVKTNYAKHVLCEDLNLTEAVLTSHAITKEAYFEIRNNNFDGFFRLRKKELMRLEREFVGRKGLEYISPQPRELDIQQLNLF